MKKTYVGILIAFSIFLVGCKEEKNETKMEPQTKQETSLLETTIYRAKNTADYIVNNYGYSYDAAIEYLDEDVVDYINSVKESKDGIPNISEEMFIEYTNKSIEIYNSEKNMYNIYTALYISKVIDDLAWEDYMYYAVKYKGKDEAKNKFDEYEPNSKINDESFGVYISQLRDQDETISGKEPTIPLKAE